MLQPKKTKFRKYQKGCIGGVKSNMVKLKFGLYGLKSLQAKRITAENIEAVTRAIQRKFKRNVQIITKVFPDIPVSSKPLEVRMGKGKGATSFWICRIQAGQILFEINGISLQLAKQAVILANYKLPIKVELVQQY